MSVHRIASTLAPQLARLLERDLFKRSDLHLVSVNSIEELVDAVQDGAELCLIEARLSDGDALDALEALRDAPEGGRVPVVLVTLADVPAPRAAGFQAVLTLPAAAGAVDELLSRLLASPRRREPRRSVPGEVLDATGKTLGRIVDLARGGLALRSRAPLAVGSTVELALLLPLHDGPLTLSARVLRVAGENVALTLAGSSALVEALAVAPPPAADGGLAFRPLSLLGDRGAAIAGVVTDGPARAAVEALLTGAGADPPRLFVADLLPLDEPALDRWIALIGAVGPIELHGCAAWLRALADRTPAVLGRDPRRARIASTTVAVRCVGCADEHERHVPLPLAPRAEAIRAASAVASRPCAICAGACAPTEALDLGFRFLPA